MIVKKSLLIIFISLNLTTVISLYAQQQKPYETLEVGLNYIENSNRNLFHQYWEPMSGVGGFWEMPYYFGSVKAGIYTFSCHAIKNSVSDFFIAYIYAGWDFKLLLFSRLNWYNGVSIGNNQMRFEDEDFSGFKDESEFGITYDSRLNFPVYKKLSINLSVSRLLIFTHKRIKLTFVAAGISYSFITPKWLQEFMK